MVNISPFNMHKLPISIFFNKKNSNLMETCNGVNKNEFIQILKKLQPNLNSKLGLTSMALFGSIARERREGSK
jgi:hypothetical protein